MHTYVSKVASGFSFPVVLKDEESGEKTRVRIKFERGQYQTDDDQIAAEIDKLLETNMAIRTRCSKADIAAAEELVRKHMAKTNMSGAQKGGVSAGAMQDAMQKHLHERDAELRKEGVDIGAVARDESLVLTEEVPVSTVVSADETDGSEDVNAPPAGLQIGIGK